MAICTGCFNTWATGYQSEGTCLDVITVPNNSEEKNAQFTKSKDVLTEKVTRDFWSSEVGCDHQYEMKISIVGTV